MKTALKIIGLLILALMCLWVCYRASGQVPPPPPKIKAVLQSPKGAEQAYSLRKVTSVAVVITGLSLVWSNAYNGSNIAFVIDHKVGMMSQWSTIGSVTNQFTYSIAKNNVAEFYRVGAFWP